LKKQNSRNTGKVIIVILIVIKHWYWNLGHRICLISLWQHNLDGHTQIVNRDG
jgi:hypothetical protein